MLALGALESRVLSSGRLPVRGLPKRFPSSTGLSSLSDPEEVKQVESSMYAVIKSGGKQYRVKEGQTLKLEKLEIATGETINFDEVLLTSDGETINVGAPFVAGAKVTAEVIDHGRGDKVTIIKFRRRKHHMKRQGHRQWYTEIKITGISG